MHKQALVGDVGHGGGEVTIVPGEDAFMVVNVEQGELLSSLARLQVCSDQLRVVPLLVPRQGGNEQLLLAASLDTADLYKLMHPASSWVVRSQCAQRSVVNQVSGLIILDLGQTVI